jgi:hypothetical protein
MGEVIVRLSLNKKDGSYSTKILSHVNGSSCGDGIDDEIVQDLLNTEIDGFGDLAISSDSGKTCEYFEEKKIKNKFHRYKYEESDQKNKSGNKNIHLGYGV